MFGNASTKPDPQGSPDAAVCGICSKAKAFILPDKVRACQECDWPFRWPRFKRKDTTPEESA